MIKGMKNDYDKALKAYHKGELKKSLEYCEIGISKNLKNSSVLNLKGLILYLKGDLEGAITVWKINKDFNDDEMSKTYIKDAESDKHREREFEKAKILIKDLHINKAIEKLEVCRESDFNSIQVNNALALCSLRKGEYDESRAYISKAILINKSDINTLTIKKELDRFTEVKGNKKMLILIIVVSISAIIMVAVSAQKDKLLNTNTNTNTDSNIVNNIENENIVDDSEKTIENEEKSKTEENLDAKINDKESIDESAKVEVVEEKNLTVEEIEGYYIDASTYFEEGNYLKAESNLNSVVKKSEGNHLNDDILFLLGSTYEKLDDINNSIKYFEKYITMYVNGDYIEEVYYKLALNSSSINLEKGKEYANKLIYNYPESIYNNSKIDSIISN